MSATEGLLRNNDAYAASFDEAGLPAAPRLKVAVVACMDARLDPARALGLKVGDAHVIRNAGGVITDDTIRSLAISQHHLGTEEVILLHHTGCGMLTFTDEDFIAMLERATGKRPAWRPSAFSDLDEDVRESIQRVRESSFLPRTDKVRGFIYEIESGRVREVS